MSVKKLVVTDLKSTVLVIKTIGAGWLFQSMAVWGSKEALKVEVLQWGISTFRSWSIRDDVYDGSKNNLCYHQGLS